MIHIYLKKMIFSPITIISALFLTLTLLLSCLSLAGFTTLWGPLYLFQYMSSVGIMYYFVPVMTVLPICLVQYEMIIKNAEVYVLHRSTPQRYIIGGIVSSAISGAVITLMAFVIFIIFCIVVDICVMAMPQYSDITENIVYTEILGNKLHDLSGTWFAKSPVWILYLREAFVFACNGVIWPVISYTVFSFSKNQYIAAAAPFIFRTGGAYILQNLKWPEWIWKLDPTRLKLSDRKSVV